MSGGSETTTQSSTSEPWSGAQPALKTGLADATNLYKSGVGFQPYTGSTVVPWSDQTMAGMGAIQNQATDALTGNNPAAKPLDFYSGLFDSGGLSADQSSVADMWRNAASGGEMGQTSPAFQTLLDKLAADAGNNVNLSMSANGRYGSGMHTDQLATAVTNAEAPLLVDEYTRQLGRMDTARANLAGIGQQGISNRMGAADALPGAWTTSELPATDLMKVGSMYEDLAGRTMADNQRIYQETQQAPLKAVEWLNAIASGAGSLGGTQSQTTTQPGTNPFLQILSGGVGLNSLLGNPLGALL